MPSQRSSRVEEAGIVLDHGGEPLASTPGSEVRLEPDDAAETVNLYFPVEIEVVGRLDDSERDALEAGVWSRLCDAIERMV